MAKIIDGDDLNVGTELIIDTTSRTIQLAVAGNLVAKDGATFQAIYSKFIKLWESSTYNKYPFPFYAIDALSGQFQIGFDGSKYNTWKWNSDTTRTYIRDAGWSEYVPTTPDASGQSSTGGLGRQYVGIVSLGDVNTGAQLYYQKTSSAAPVNFTFTDEVNEGIQVFGDAAVDTSTTTFDNRTYFKGFVREYNKKYKDSVLSDTGKTSTGAYLVNLLLSNEDDLDIVATDAGMTASPYTAINVKYFPSNYTKAVESGTGRNFGIVIDVGTFSGVDGSATSGGATMTTAAAGIPTDGTYDGGTLTIHEGTNKGTYTIGTIVAAGSVPITTTFPATESTASFTLQRATPVNATLKQIYTKVQYLLRQNSDIDSTSGTVNGKTAVQLLNFVGSSLKAGFYAPTNPNGGGSGVMVEGIAAADINSIVFYDNTATSREYPYASAGTLNFNSFLTSGSAGYYRMYFTDPTVGAGDAYGESGAITVNDKDGNPIAGTINSSSIAFTFDYTGNVQGGRTGNTNAEITLVAGNKGYAKPVVVTGTITASKTISFSATAEQDRAYVA